MKREPRHQCDAEIQDRIAMNLHPTAGMLWKQCRRRGAVSCVRRGVLLYYCKQHADRATDKV